MSYNGAVFLCSECRPIEPTWAKHSTFSSFADLETHIETAHSASVFYECEFCRFSCQSTSEATSHLLSCHPDSAGIHLRAPTRSSLARPQRILLSSLALSTVGSRRRRAIPTKLPADRNLLGADSFEEPSIEAKLVLDSANSSLTASYCQLCEETVYSGVNWSRAHHVCRVHLSGFPYTCSLCPGSGFLTKAALKLHCSSRHKGVSFVNTREIACQVDQDDIAKLFLQCFPPEQPNITPPLPRGARMKVTASYRTLQRHVQGFVFAKVDSLSTVRQISASSPADKDGEAGNSQPACCSVLRLDNSYARLWHMLILCLSMPSGLTLEVMRELTRKYFEVSPALDNDRMLTDTLRRDADACVQLKLVDRNEHGSMVLSDSLVWLAEAVKKGSCERLIKALLLEEVQRRRGERTSHRSAAKVLAARTCPKCGLASSVLMHVESDTSICGYSFQWRCVSNLCDYEYPPTGHVEISD